MIEIADVSKAYGDTLVLENVSLSLPKGALTAIVGPNGAGKSTLLSIAARLMPMTSGRVHIDGLDVSRGSGEVLAKRVAILRQDNHITPRLMVEELVGFGRYPHSKGRPSIEDQAKIDEAIAYVGLADQRRRFLDELSGGQRQRAFLAMVLAQDTDVLFLDEPLNNLDMKHARAMMTLVRRAVDELGKTAVVVMHDINFASCYADRIVAMKDGRVAMQGGPDEIMRPEALAAIYDMEIRIEEVAGMRLGIYYR